MLTGEVEQKGCFGIVAVCASEIGYQIIPADNGLYLDGEIFHDIHFVLVREVVFPFFGDAYGCKMFAPQIGEHEEIKYLFLVRTELTARYVGFHYLPFGIFNRPFYGYLLVALVLLLQLLNG